jgi:putative membrane protein
MRYRRTVSEPTPRPREETLRIHQANERTMLAWIRTGIAIMAFGFALERFAFFLRQFAAVTHTMPASHGLGSTWIGAALVGLGTAANALATLRYRTVRRAIDRGDVGAPSAGLVYSLGVTATIVGIAMSVLLGRALGD